MAWYIAGTDDGTDDGTDGGTDGMYLGSVGADGLGCLQSGHGCSTGA